LYDFTLPLKRRDHLKGTGVEERVILTLEGLDWIHLTQGRDRRRAVVSTVMNIRVP
jgi:hypothetical protein